MNWLNKIKIRNCRIASILGYIGKRRIFSKMSINHFIDTFEFRALDFIMRKLEQSTMSFAWWHSIEKALQKRLETQWQSCWMTLMLSLVPEKLEMASTSHKINVIMVWGGFNANGIAFLIMDDVGYNNNIKFYLDELYQQSLS